MENKLFVSVDMDEWYLARWATGSKYAKWNTVEDVFKEVYKLDKPIGEINEPTERILELFDSINFKSTFFFTGQIATYYPDLVKRISSLGHEIASHNFYHLDYEHETRKQFRNDLEKSKKLLEDLSGQKVIGYRSPNSSIPKSLVGDLEEFGFKYDSSLTPTRRFMGKFGKFTNAPQRPYHPSYEDIGAEGKAKLLEIPWSVFPFFKFPAGSGIMHRIMGNLYNNVATNYSIKQGTTAYYFHPYELKDSKYIDKKRFNKKVKIFLRNCGDTYFKNLEKFLKKNKNLLINGREMLNNA